jgi:hypothetical protein
LVAACMGYVLDRLILAGVRVMSCFLIDLSRSVADPCPAAEAMQMISGRLVAS